MVNKKPETKRKTKKQIESNNILERQQIKDLEHRVDMELNTYIVLKEEGSANQMALASQKAKSALLKYGPDMYRIAQEIGGSFPITVENYINSVSNLLHSAMGWIDEASLQEYYTSAQMLRQEIRL